MLVKYGAQERALAAQRSRQVRLFRRFETLTTYLKEIGIERFEVDAEDYDPALPKTARRPDFFRCTDALKRTHAAAAYDTWFRAQVQASIDDPRPSVDDETVQQHFARRREALRHSLQQHLS